MSKPKLNLVTPISAGFTLPADQAELLEEMFHGYRQRRVGAQNHKEKSVSSDLAFVSDLVQHSEKAPWAWQESDFERWCLHLGTERCLAVASQRKYQLAIKSFLQYLIDSQAFVNEVHKRYKVRLRQICHRGNMIPHVQDRELEKPKSMMSKEQLKKMLDAVGEGADIAESFRSKSWRPLQRDYAMFAIMFHLGLRVSEACRLDIDSFSLFEESGCAFANVAGKGSRGSGPKFRNVPILSKQTLELIVWYLREVRPHLASPRHPNERALFLSERGTRISRGAVENRFQNAINLAGLDGRGFTPHGLRHGQLTAIQLEGLSTESARRFAGHAHSSTTQLYTHVGDDYVLEEFKRFISRTQGGQP